MSTRAQPAATERWRGKIAKQFDPKPEYLIPILQFVQGEEGYLPPEAMEATARHLRLPTSKVYGVASFYAQFNFEPQGKHNVTVCRGTACHVRGSGPLLRDMETRLGIGPGETTKDLGFTLKTVACFGSCALAPVVVVNGRVHGRQSKASLKTVIDHVDSTGQDKKAQQQKKKPTARKRGK